MPRPNIHRRGALSRWSWAHVGAEVKLAGQSVCLSASCLNTDCRPLWSAGGASCLAAQPGDGGLDALAVLRWWVGRRIDGMAAGAALQDDVVSGGFFIGEVVGRRQADGAVAKR